MKYFELRQEDYLLLLENFNLDYWILKFNTGQFYFIQKFRASSGDFKFVRKFRANLHKNLFLLWNCETAGFHPKCGVLLENSQNCIGEILSCSENYFEYKKIYILHRENLLSWSREKLFYRKYFTGKTISLENFQAAK